MSGMKKVCVCSCLLIEHNFLIQSNSKSGYKLMPWTGYRSLSTRLTDAAKRSTSGASSQEKTDNMALRTLTTKRRRAGSSTSLSSLPSSIKTIEVEYHPKLGSTTYYPGTMDLTADELAKFKMHKTQRTVKSSGPPQIGTPAKATKMMSISDRLRAESDRFITEQFENSEQYEYMRRGRLADGTVVEVISRVLFLFLCLANSFSVCP